MRMQRLFVSFVVAFGAVITAARAARAGEITVSPTSGSPAAAVHAGNTGTIGFQVSNGSGAESITDVAAAGTHCAEFALTTPATFPDNIGNNATENWEITFTPTSGGRGARGPCVFTLNDPDGNEDTFTATATATQPNMSTSVSALAFPDTHLGTTQQMTVTVRNLAPSNEVLDFTTSITGTDAARFSVSPASGTVAIGGTATLTVTFAPTTLRGAHSATLTINGDDIATPSIPITLSGNGTAPVMTTSPASRTFADTHVGTTAPTQTVTITNDAAGNENLDWTAVVIAGNTDYSVVPASGTLAPGASTNVTVTFVPTARGTRNGTLRITGDDPGNGSDDVSLTGVGLSPDMVVTWTGSPGALDFGTAPVTSGSNQRTVTVQNSVTGNEDLTFTGSITAGGTDYAVTLPADLTLAPGQSTTVTVTFDPTTIGTRNGTLTITSNDAIDGTDTVSLTGVGTQTQIALSPSSLAFGNVKISQQSATSNVTITNPGNTTLSITRLQITGTGASQFQFVSNGCSGQDCQPASPFTILGGGSDSEIFGIRCIPSLPAGNHTATLTVTGNQEAGTDTLTMTCTGTAPDVSNPSVASLDFGDVIVGQTLDLSFTISNTASGAGAETLDYSISMPANYTVPAPGCTSNCTLAAGSMRTVTVRFAPTARQAYPGTITITTDDPDEATKTVTVTGTGIAPVIGNPSPSNTTLAFGPVDVGTTSSSMTASIQNVGDSPLNITSVTLTGTNANQFTITSGSTGAHSVAVGGTDAWGVACAPTSIGAKSATLRISSDALGATTFNFSLTCTGQQAVFTFAPGAGLDFGGVFVGQSSTLSATITNTGNKAGDVTSIVSGNSVFTFTVVGGAPPRTVAPNGSLQVDVTFTPVNGSVVASNLTVMTTGSPSSFTIPLLGDGRTQGVDITVVDEADLMVDLGEIRVGNPVQKQVIVQNSGDTAYTLTVPSSDDAHCVIQLVNPTSYPAVIPGGGTAVFNVNTTATALGAESCNVTVASSIPTSDTIAFTFVGVAPDVELVNPANGILDYAGVDVDTSQMQTVTVRNTGSFPLTISSCALTGSARFTLQTSCASPIQVAEAQSTALDVLFDPTIEAVESATLTLAVDALDVSQVQVQLTGVGVDQHIDLPSTTITFPPTFRNPDPDDTPTEMVVVVNPKIADPNNPGAPLTVTMAVTEDAFDEVFVVTNPGPYTVQPDGQIEVPVQFRPTAAGTPFSAQLTVFNDTTENPMAAVTLTGEGISRLVDVAPRSVADFGRTGVGVPVRLSDVVGDVRGIAVSNIDPSGEVYQVRALAFADTAGDPIEYDGPFHIVTRLDQPRELGANATEVFDVEFVPEEAGTYTVLLGVYLDGDPKAHSTVMLRGEAVDIDLSGGGGCQAGGRGGWGGLVVVALGLLALRRRRVAALAVVAAVGVAAPARADTTRNMDIATFAPAPATEVETFTVESPQVGVSGAWALDLVVSHATNILRASAADGTGDMDVPVTARTSLQVGFAYAFADMFEAGLRVPFFMQSGEAPEFSGLTPAEGNAIGDVAAHVKARLLEGAAVSLAASLDVTLPTATDEIYAGSKAVTGHARAIAGWKSRRLGLNGNVGFIARRQHDLGNRVQGNAVSYGAGAWLRAIDKMWVIGEVFGTAGMGPTGDVQREVESVSQLEGVLGLRYEVARSVGVSLGAGRGIVPGIGTPDFRGFVLVDVAPRAREHGPLVVRTPPPPRDTRDDDGDGVVNADDQCSADAEDVDEWQDDDGCPDADNDGDGLLDGADRCPIEAEDGDGFQDEDGCVDRDNDNDKIADVDDKCPAEAEDLDGHMDSDGCDEPDNDFDGIPDVIDQCALEPETINGKADDDGCPDEGESLVMVMPDRIEIFEPVTFDGTSAKLTRKSAKVLGQVAATLRANRDFVRVRVTVHVHPRSGKDQELSEKRAKAVRDWLVQWGIEPERVESRGLGSSRPLVPKSQKGAAQLNDRVEFIILEKAVK